MPTLVNSGFYKIDPWHDSLIEVNTQQGASTIILPQISYLVQLNITQKTFTVADIGGYVVSNPLVILASSEDTINGTVNGQIPISQNFSSLTFSVASGNEWSAISIAPISTVFNFQQDVPSTEWVINHNMSYYPSVTVVDSAGTVVTGEVSYQNSNTAIVKFSAAFAGKAYLS
jgi:hypothetical protein